MTLSYGSSGDEVKTLQQNLKNAGYDVGDVDGIYGAKTQAAVKSYQTNNGLTADGIYGTNTAAKLTSAGANTAVTSGASTATAATQATTDYTPYATARDNLYQQIMNYKYDANSDPLYQQYKALYTQQGKQAMEDTIGQAAALTGGYGNTYGTVAGQQQYNAYMQKLNELIPDLADRDYSKLTANYNLMSTRADADKEDAQTQVSALISIGQMPSDELIARSGYDKNYLQTMANYYQQQLLTGSSGSGSSSGSSRRSSSSSSGDTTQAATNTRTTTVTNSSGKTTTKDTSATVKHDILSGLKKTAVTYINLGNWEKAEQVIERSYETGQITESEMENLINTLNKEYAS